MNESRTVIAVPSQGAGGLEAARSDHFGHAENFTVVTLEQGTPTAVDVLENPHGSGGCLSPVALLAQAGVDAITVAGIGGRPLAAFRQAGVAVFLDRASSTVAESVMAIADGTAVIIGDDDACGGHGGGCGGH